MHKQNELLLAVKKAFAGYKIDPTAGSISVVNQLQSISFALRSDDSIAVQSSVSGLDVDMKVWETRPTIADAIEFGLSLIMKPEDQPEVDLDSPDQRSEFVLDGEGPTEILESEIVEPSIVTSDLIGLS